MKIFFDTEFIEDGKTIDLVSIGMVREDGQKLYMESIQADLSKADKWFKENVQPHLFRGNMLFQRSDIAELVKQFAGDAPEFWAYYADYDWIALCQLYGRMIDLPKGWPMYCRDLKQEADRLSIKFPKQESTEHHALADAEWNAEMYMRFIANI